MLFTVEHLGQGILIGCLVMEDTAVMGTKSFYKKKYLRSTLGPRIRKVLGNLYLQPSKCYSNRYHCNILGLIDMGFI